MKLLFNETTASDTFKDLLGFVDADINFRNLLPDFLSASREVYDLIGKEVYAKAIDLFDEDNILEDFNNPDYMFVRHMQYPIALRAYAMYAPNNDLSHTNDGRKMRNEKHEKQAFQWMIDNDNSALEKKYYKALDDLIHFLDNSKIEVELTTTIYTIWTNSEAYINSQKLFIRTVKEFDHYYPINSRLLLLRFSPGISDCERREILSRVGKTKFEELKAKLKTNQPIEEEKDLLLLELIREACASYSLAWAIPRFNVNFFPEGILQFYGSDMAQTSGKKPSLMMEPEAARQAYVTTCKRALLDIENLLKPLPNNLDDLPIQPNINYGDKHFSA